MRRLATLAATVALAMVPATAAAQCPKASLPDLEDEVMCPVCGTALNLAGAPQADDERKFIRDLIDQCKTKDEIKDALVAEYGDEVLALPSGDGFDLAVYLVPGAAILLGLGGVAFAAPRWRKRSQAQPPAAAGPELSDDDRQRLDDELARFDR